MIENLHVYKCDVCDVQHSFDELHVLVDSKETVLMCGNDFNAFVDFKINGGDNHAV